MARQASRDGRLEAVLALLRGPRRGAMSRADAVKALGERGLRQAVRGGDLVELLPRVYVAGARQHEHVVRCTAVVVWGRGRLRIAGASALHLLNSRFAAPADVHAVGVVRHHAHAPEWVQIRRVGLPRVYVNRFGVRCVPGEEALIDAWTRALPTKREDLLYVALWEEVVGVDRLREVLDRTPRVPGVAEMDAILGEFAAGARSPAEVLARRRVFVGAEFAALERGAEFLVAGTWRHPDLVHRKARLVIECDGDAYHGVPGAVAADRQRDADFLEIGYATIRFGFHDLLERPERCRQKLRGTIRSRLGSE
ncbi:DUF559 domain-containing protein [Demequina sp. SYSU T00192]|uniref:DUF559 domain-containing protein n=1 Tax=Demequina litoralis TaxID=3051660 RepID=A0ABT8G7V4_9MICO|nr:DUF559 domain-containing protein [Demequina sp. SYSU T00192]MDN4475230.1 DUF559 domain-containing protein [Demequina sp. SYSU T00192]